MSGYLAYIKLLNREHNKNKHRNMMLLKDDKYSGVT